MNSATAYWLEEERLVQGTPKAYFPFLNHEKHVISLVGGGGKTTLLYHLAECFRHLGRRTAVMTTTKMGRPAHACQSQEACLSRWEAGQYAVCGQRMEDGKFRAPAPAFLTWLLQEADAVLIEADGARRLPCKAPADHEPVIVPETDIVIGVMGLDALNRPVGETCLRPERVQQLLNCTPDHLLTCQDLARLLLSPQGSRKGVEHREFFAVLNKCDTPQRLFQGEQLLRLLEQQGQRKAVLTCGMQPSEELEHANS